MRLYNGSSSGTKHARPVLAFGVPPPPAESAAVSVSADVVSVVAAISLDPATPKRVKVDTPTGAIAVSSSKAFDMMMMDDGTVVSGLTTVQASSSLEPALTGEDYDEEGTSDCGASMTSINTNNVAHLRSWLDDFGRQQKTHYDKNVSKPDASALTKPPARPKVKAPETAKPPTPLPKKAATLYTKRCSVDGNARQSILTTAAALPPCSTTKYRHEARQLAKLATPVRLLLHAPTPPPAPSVQATNEGYATVAQLSAWLAEDPTKPKKATAKHTLRGANVVAKSQIFDKNLAHIVMTEPVVLRHAVQHKKEWLQSAFVHDSAAALETANEVVSVASQTASDDVKVSDQKDWLAHAIAPSSSSSQSAVGVETRSHPAAARAKHKWRASSITTTPVKKVTTATSGDARMSAIALRTNMKILRRNSVAGGVHMTPVPNNQAAPTDISVVEATATVDMIPSITTASSSSNSSTASLRPCLDETERRDDAPAPDDDTSKDDEVTLPSFAAARNLLVERSKANGHDVDVLTKVRLRTAKFERQAHDLERRRQRRQTVLVGTSELLKPSWSEDSHELAPSAGAYVKILVNDVAPKKSLDELP